MNRRSFLITLPTALVASTSLPDTLSKTNPPPTPQNAPQGTLGTIDGVTPKITDHWIWMLQKAHLENGTYIITSPLVPTNHQDPTPS